MDVPSKLRICVAREDIAAAVRRLAAELTRDYHDKNPLLIGVLKGAFVFLSDLVRQLDFPLDVDFLRVSSYDSGMETSGKVRVVQPFRAEVRGRNVLLEIYCSTSVSASIQFCPIVFTLASPVFAGEIVFISWLYEPVSSVQND